MPELHIDRLAEPLWPLLNKFYRSHNSPMKALKGGQLWVAKGSEIVAGLCLTPVVGGQWLTGLFVDPAMRGQGLAAQLVRASVAGVEGTVWLLCHPDLEGFYQRLGFTQDTLLPQSLSERLVRYKRNKPMIAMGLEPLVRSTFNKV
ncbi:GNAT family N-acetyltransferase [Pseudomonas yamanorum]|jgi:GNAT superfamily N-acetyltransferase|uniref:GNAT family N-acetyltransferase n=1 Tax=Pseudomonas yamanorum TaxID=515393 RepID=A0AAJ3LFZ8_9PSED|nr:MULTISPECIES: GNAT family N-acetyltransferase [Pseudomonas]MDR0190931.1 GNAT family N-acetyltransferase [Pseudomonas yamanorum]NVZ92290.1 GNAT family N-acetyltransferase [Pseudomonas yamanorum]NWD41635.1 GNAT family N-acetyltransferase [Pseudomonas yamanorum]WVN15834.1 GNAT family N-acetyltransferase [Pseudomonas yamanorum]